MKKTLSKKVKPLKTKKNLNKVKLFKVRREAKKNLAVAKKSGNLKKKKVNKVIIKKSLARPVVKKKIRKLKNLLR